MKIPYSEGSVFLVPLEDGGYARGVVARVKRGKVVLGYFFGPRLLSEKGARLDDLAPANAVLRIRFGDLGLINGEWPILGQLENWDRGEWPMPDFARQELLTGKTLLVRYSDDDPRKCIEERYVDDAPGLPSDGMAGYGFVEIRLSKLLR